MGANTTIQWATHTFNPWRGCAKVAEGCANCYAEAQSKRNKTTLGVWGPKGSRVVASEAMWREPLKWNRAAECHHSFDCCHTEHGDACPQSDRPRVFCGSLCDVFEDWGGEMRGSSGGVMWDAPGLSWQEQMLPGRTDGIMRDAGGRRLTLDDVRARLFQLIDATPSLDWLLLTKRPENVRRMWPIAYIDDAEDCEQEEERRFFAQGDVRERKNNVWLGTSIACQEDADQNIPELLKCRDLAAKLFLSIEPLVGDVNLRRFFAHSFRCASYCGQRRGFDESARPCDCGRPRIGWVIVGGESGPRARPCDIAWIRSIVRQCREAGVPVFIKQLGARCVKEHAGGDTANTAYRAHGWVSQVGTAYHAGWFKCSDKKGGDPAEWPEDIRVREVPT